MFTLKKKIQLLPFVLILSALNFLFFHYPFFKFVFNNANCTTSNGIFLVVSLVILMLILNALVFFVFLFLSRLFGKILLVLFFCINAVAVYFINTYSVILDESMIGNVFNTDYNEASSFFSVKLVGYFVVFGIIPSWFIIQSKILPTTPKKFSIYSSLTLLFVLLLVFLNSSNWLWIDKNSKTLGGLAMPWSYAVNTSLHFVHEAKKNQKEIILPNATITDTQKAVVILVIGESARSQNFSIYGYKKNTNPLLSKIKNVFHFDATSDATYTTAGVKSILEHENTDELYEILPNYLFRNKVEVLWRTTNWGEPPIHIKNFQNKNFLKEQYPKENSEYDQILLQDLKNQILNSSKNKVLIVLHTSTSHGPTYSKKYPPKFETFKPVCNSVELANCSQTELINAYDNTIVYTDYILANVIKTLKELKEYQSTMIFVSDHGESLGEKNLYMHGIPLSIAPKEQYEIPFIVWLSDNSKKKIKPNSNLTQNYVFHSVLNFLSIKSPIYNEKLNLFE